MVILRDSTLITHLFQNMGFLATCRQVQNGKKVTILVILGCPEGQKVTQKWILSAWEQGLDAK